MTDKRARMEYRHRDTLRNSGWAVSQTDYVAFNSGSESRDHFLTKAIVAYELKQQGYRVASEVEGPGGEIDIVSYGTEDHPLAIEVETNPTEEVIQDKLERYVRGQPFRDILVIDVDGLPENIHEARGWVKSQL